MRIMQKLVLGFLLISLMVGVVGYISLIRLDKVAAPLNKEIPEAIKTVGETSHLDSLAQLIRYYDEVLTQSARNYVFTGEKKWKKRYQSIEPKLDKIIKGAIKNGDERDKEFFSNVNKANLALVEMEYMSIELVNNDQMDAAIKILESSAYWNEKLAYEQGLRNYVQRRGVKYGESLLNSTKIIELATKDAQSLIKASSKLVFIFTIIALILAIGIGIYISRLISNPITKLKNATVEIGKGKLETNIIINSKDEIGQLAGSIKDMAEQLQKTTVSRDYVDSIIGNMMDSLIVLSPDGKIKTVNQSTLELLGYREDEILNQSIDIIFAKESLLTETNFISFIKQYFGRIIEIVCLSRDGKKIPVLFSGSEMRDVNGNLKGIICVALDVTERKQIEDKLRFSDFAVDNNADATYWIKSDAKIAYANKTACQVLGYSYKELTSLRVSDIDPDFPIDSWSSHWQKMKDAGTLIFEAHHKTKDGQVFPVEIQTTYLEYDSQEYICAYARNVTERKKMENEVLKVQKLESLGVLAGGVAHDFNNLLTAILGNTQMALLSSKPEDEICKTLINIQKASIRARDLTQQLLTFSKGGEPVRKVVSIAELIKEASGFAVRGSKVKFELSIPEELWHVDVDEGQINQVINNLVINAVQCMPKGGTLKVSARNIGKIDKELTSPLKQINYIKVAIKDQGSGIKNEHLSTIFDPYFTTKKTGSGLGLTSSYSIIKKHGGLITVATELGAGTTFYVYLPAVERKAVKEKEKDDKLVIGSGKILIMDDDDAVRDVGSRTLSFIGYEVECAKDGSEAIDLYKKAMESRKPFDVVIMDLTIPGGMGGMDAIKKLKGVCNKVKAIVFSGYSNDPIIANYEKYGFKGVICKPFEIIEMNEVLQKVING